MPQRHKLGSKASGLKKVKSFKRKNRKCENQTSSFLLYSCVARAVSKNKFNSKRVYGVYSKSDPSQLLTIAYSQEQEKRNKIIVQAERQN